MKLPTPFTERMVPGEVVPIPTRPEAFTTNAVEDALVTASKILPVDAPHAVSFEYGDVVPMPTLPDAFITILMALRLLPN